MRMERRDFEQLVDDLTKKLNDDGLVVRAGFVGYMTAVYGKDWAKSLHSSKRRDYEMAFMAGAAHLFHTMMTVLDEGEDPTESDMNRMNLIAAEIAAVGAKFALRMPTQGRG